MLLALPVALAAALERRAAGRPVRPPGHPGEPRARAGLGRADRGAVPARPPDRRGLAPLAGARRRHGHRDPAGRARRRPARPQDEGRDPRRGDRRLDPRRRRARLPGLLPDANPAVDDSGAGLVGLGLGLTVDSLTQSALRDRVPRALHGGWTIAARHGGIVVGLLILTPIFTSDLKDAQRPAQEAIAAQVLDSDLPATSKLKLAEGLGAQLEAEDGRVPDLSIAFEKAAAAERAGRAGRGARGPPRRPARASGDPRVPRRVPGRRRARAARDPPRPVPAREGDPGMSSRGIALIAVALVLSAGLLGVQLASGGADFVPQRAADPCQDRGRTVTTDLEGLAETVVLTGLDEAACKLGVSRERLLLALPSKRTAPSSRGRPAPTSAAWRRRSRTACAPASTGSSRPVSCRRGRAPAVGRRPARHPEGLVGLIPDGLVDSLPPTADVLRPSLDNDRREHRPRGPRRRQVARVDPPRGTRPRRDRQGQGRAARPAPRAPALSALRQLGVRPRAQRGLDALEHAARRRRSAPSSSPPWSAALAASPTAAAQRRAAPSRRVVDVALAGPRRSSASTASSATRSWNAASRQRPASASARARSVSTSQASATSRPAEDGAEALLRAQHARCGRGARSAAADRARPRRCQRPSATWSPAPVADADERAQARARQRRRTRGRPPRCGARAIDAVDRRQRGGDLGLDVALAQPRLAPRVAAGRRRSASRAPMVDRRRGAGCGHARRAAARAGAAGAAPSVFEHEHVLGHRRRGRA